VFDEGVVSIARSKAAGLLLKLLKFIRLVEAHELLEYAGCSVVAFMLFGCCSCVV